MARVIFHIDMNCFFASCEQAVNPKYKNLPLIVIGGDLQRGMVLSATYDARSCGVKATMLISEARRLCPKAIFVQSHYDIYYSFFQKFVSYFKTITPLVEPASIDEAYLDVTGICEPSEYVNLAKTIQDTLLNKYLLPCSIGIGPNKFLAKMGSDYKKPLGITVLRKREVQTMLWPLPISDLFGCGKKTCELLNIMKINTIGDLANYQDIDYLYKMIGINHAKDLISRCYGEGSSDVDPNRYNQFESISKAHTFNTDIYNYDTIVEKIKHLLKSICDKLEKDNLLASNFSLQLKFNNFKVSSKSITIDPTNDYSLMLNTYERLLNHLFDPDLPVRLVSIGCQKLSSSVNAFKQLTIFDNLNEEEMDHEVKTVIENINKTFGKDMLIIGTKNIKNKSLK